MQRTSQYGLVTHLFSSPLRNDLLSDAIFCFFHSLLTVPTTTTTILGETLLPHNASSSRTESKSTKDWLAGLEQVRCSDDGDDDNHQHYAFG